MFVLDTCTVSDFLKHIDPGLNRKILNIPPQHIFISALTVDEMEYGLSRNPVKAKQYRPLVLEFLAQIGAAHVLPIDSDVAKTSGQTRANLSQQGIVVAHYDLLIGVTALVHKMVLVTSNLKHFKMIPGLVVEDWRSAKQ